MIDELSYEQVMKKYDRSYYPQTSKTYADGYEDGFKAGRRAMMDEMCKWIAQKDNIIDIAKG